MQYVVISQKIKEGFYFGNGSYGKLVEVLGWFGNYSISRLSLVDIVHYGQFSTYRGSIEIGEINER